jgi:hypothetical protein
VSCAESRARRSIGDGERRRGARYVTTAVDVTTRDSTANVLQ